MRSAVRVLLCLFVVACLGGLLRASYLVTRIPPRVAPAPPPPPSPAAPPALAPLPEVEIKDVPIHAVPPDSATPGAAEIPHRHVSDEVANGPSAALPPAPPKQFSGIAVATGPAALEVGHVPVALYGVKPPQAHDRCGLAGSCAAAAKRALAARLSPKVRIYCQTPAPKPGRVVAYAICLDGNGVDLGGYLVSEGLALADTGQSYDYVGAESIARGQKRGLWGYR